MSAVMKPMEVSSGNQDQENWDSRLIMPNKKTLKTKDELEEEDRVAQSAVGIFDSLHTRKI
jgi:hypothetical protein